MKYTGKSLWLRCVLPNWHLLIAAVLLLIPPALGADAEAEGSSAGGAAGLPATEEGPAAGGVWIIPIRGEIEPSLAVFVRREGRRAQSRGAGIVVFEIDTFGGRVDTALEITSFIMSIKNARTVAWVNNSDNSMGVSWSAGALIALSCSEIYMGAGTSIGAAAPVTLGPGGEAESAGEKTVAAVRSQMAALAERNGYPTGIALAMVDMDVELWEARVNGAAQVLTLADLERLEKNPPAGGAGSAVERMGLVSPKGKLLSLTSGEAVRYGLARGIADDRDSLLAALGASGEISESRPGFSDGIVSFLTSGPVQSILILLGLVMIFLEINSPGFGVPGVTAIISFLLVFGSGLLLGQVGSAELILFLLGIGLLAVEIFIIPGFGAVGISGIILIGISLILSMQDFVIPRFEWEWGILGRNAVVVSAALIFALLAIVLIALLGPRVRIFNGLTLQTRITGTASGPSEADGPTAGGPGADNEIGDYAALRGKTGTALSTLRPVGKAEIEGQRYTVEADGTFIEPGTAVRVINVQGNQITVRSV
jgi:membrane-bound serine protease (ClpP class)